MSRSNFIQYSAPFTILLIALLPFQVSGQVTLRADLSAEAFTGFRQSHVSGNSWSFGGDLYFNTGGAQGSLWRYDGSSTHEVLDEDLLGYRAEVVGDRLIFQAAGDNGQNVLKRIEGGVVSTIDFESGAWLYDFERSTRYQDLIIYPGKVETGAYYEDGVVWATDGITTSRIFTSPYVRGEMPYRLAATNEGVYLFFHHFNYDNGTTYYTGEDVWFLENGQGPGTLIHQFDAINGQQSAVKEAVAVGDALYLMVQRTSGDPRQLLWRMTRSSLDNIPLDEGRGPSRMTSVGSRLYFQANNKVWYAEGTQAVKLDDRDNQGSLAARPQYMVHDDVVYFRLRDNSSSPWQLYRHSVADSEVTRLDDHSFIEPPIGKGEYVVRPEGIFFKAMDTTSQSPRGYVEEFWFTDGSSIKRLSDNVRDRMDVHRLIGMRGDEILYSGLSIDNTSAGLQLWALDLNQTGSESTDHTLIGFDQSGDAFNWILDATAPVDSGYVFGPNIYGDQAKAVNFSLPDQATVGALNSVTLWWGHKRDGLSGGTYDLQVFNGSSQTGPQGAPIFSKAYNLVDIVGDADEGTPLQPMTYQFDSPVTVGSDFFVAVDFGQYSADLIGGMTLASGNYTGQSVPEVWEQWGDGTWHTVSSAWLNDANGWRLWAEAEVSIGGSVANETNAVLPEGISLDPNYPNPFNPSTEIGYTLSSAGHVTLDVYDLTGRMVKRLVDRQGVPGQYSVRMNGEGLPSGLYFYRLRQNGLTETRSMILLK